MMSDVSLIPAPKASWWMYTADCGRSTISEQPLKARGPTDTMLSILMLRRQVQFSKAETQMVCVDGGSVHSTKRVHPANANGGIAWMFPDR